MNTQPNNPSLSACCGAPLILFMMGLGDERYTCSKCNQPTDPKVTEEREGMMNDQPWPLRDIVSKLCEATEILLHEKNYDGHGHEQISCALRLAKSWIGTQEKDKPNE